VCHIILLFLGDRVPPILEFIGKLNVPGHNLSMPYTEYRWGPLTEAFDRVELSRLAAV
jgi:hypothetical protein